MNYPSLIALTVNSQLRPIVLLSTILVQMRCITIETFKLHALLDSGAQASYITDQWAYRSLFRRNRYNVHVNALSNTPLKRIKTLRFFRIMFNQHQTFIPVQAIIV